MLGRQLLLASFSVLSVLAYADPVGQGHLDRVDINDREMQISGWAGSQEPQHFITQLMVRLDQHEVYRGRVQRADRPDVASSTGRSDWLGSGISARFKLPADLRPGAYSLTVSVRRSDGPEFSLSADAQHQHINLPDWARPSHSARLALFLALVLPLACLLPWRARRPAPTWQRASGFAWALLASFVLLLASRTSGSSLGLLLQAPTISSQQAQLWAGTPKPIRSDEWQVITPLALAQQAHHPPWPKINSNLGSHGQNMLVIGMTGVPVAHPSTLAKPATWGYFALDVSRAQSWAWWLPLFGSLLAFWGLLMQLTGLSWRPAAILASCLALAPYSVGFSSWPAYLSMFAALGLLAFHRLLHASRTRCALGWGSLLAWAAVGYALVLYPAWQVSLAVLCIPLALAWAWQERQHWSWRWPQTLGTLLALVVAAFLLWTWWQDVQETVAIMRETVYPGQRSSESGGDIDRWFQLKGWLNPLTLHVESPMASSEAASFQFLWLPSLMLAAWIGWHQRRLQAVPSVLAGFALFCLAYQYIGFPAWFSQHSPWGYVTSYRLDLALGMAQLLLLAWCLAQLAQDPSARPPRWLIGVVVLLVLLISLRSMTHMPLDIREAIPVGFMALSLSAMAAAGALLLLGQRGSFLALYAGWTLAASLPYHPVGRMPQQLQLDPPLLQAGLQQGSSSSDPYGTVVIGERNWAMVLSAAGAPVLNSVFYHPPLDFWQRLDPTGQQYGIYNRYQRLLIDLAPQNHPSGWTVESPRLDEVRLLLDPCHFDFSQLGVRHVLLSAQHPNAHTLTCNPTLSPVPVPSDRVYSLYRISPAALSSNHSTASSSSVSACNAADAPC